MICKNLKKMLKIPFLALLAVGLLAGPSFALTYHLAAVDTTWTTPDTATAVNMWAFIQVNNAVTYDCNTPAPAWDVGPTIDVPAGENLTIYLKNCVSDSVSVFIPGQRKTTTPQFTAPDSQGRRRVTSFDTVTPSGGTVIYTWNNPKEGTYLYQSGTFVAKQVPKGLYGPLVVRGNTYPTAPQEQILVYSEIDPDLNNAAAGAGQGARVDNYHPKYFLINGDTYPNTEVITTNLNTDVMLRFVNAGLHSYFPTLQTLYMSVFADDGNLLPFALDQYQIELTAAKTMDAMVNLGATRGRYALYDRSLHLTNAAVPDGGMLTFIQTPNNTPAANPDAYSVIEGTVLSVAAPGVMANDTDVDGDPLTAYLTGTAPPGVLAFNSDGSFTYTPAGVSGAVESFQYFVNDGMVNSAPATVTITVTTNIAPIANNDYVVTPRNQSLIINILENDVDPDGTLDVTSVALTSPTTTRGGSVVANGDGTVTYTPDGSGGPDYFWYTVNDTLGATSNQARVRINRVGETAAPAPAPASTQSPGRSRITR